jgi:hypothetical protein
MKKRQTKAVTKTKAASSSANESSSESDRINTRRNTSALKKKSSQYSKISNEARTTNKRDSKRQETIELVPKKRGRPKKYTDSELEAIEEEKQTQTEMKRKETIQYFSGAAPETKNETSSV